MADRQLFCLAVLFYVVAFVHGAMGFRRGFKQPGVGHYFILGVGLVAHTVSMAMRGIALGRCPVTNLYEATVFVAWPVAIGCFGVALVSNLRFISGLGTPVLCVLGLVALVPRMDTHPPEITFTPGITTLHMSLALLGYGAFGLAALVSAMYLVQEHDLRFRRLRALTTMFPPLEQLDSAAPALVGAGWILLSAGVVIGMAWLKRTSGVFLKADPKILWAIFVWTCYGLLLGLRHWRGLKGRMFAWPSIACFGFVLLTYWGFSLLSEIHNPYWTQW
ncbi:MAG: cytochrome c biogenesis protein [Verrucomicrobiae bacterium]|nr:cytochrome c biogenesis protein [Verrucomicrobiae bacterium]